MKNKLSIFLILIIAFLAVVFNYIQAINLTPQELNQLQQKNIGASVFSVYQGGTGASSFTAGECLVGNDTGAITTQACGGAGTSIWATSTDGTALYYNDSYVLVVGATATTTAVGQSMEIVGGLLTDEATTTGLTINGERFTDLTGTGLQNSAGVLTLNATGDWTGTFDGQDGSYYLARANHTGTQATSTITGLFDSTNIADNYLLNTGDVGNGTYTFGTTTFTGDVEGISLSEIEDLTDDKVFTMANKNLTYRFTNPDGGILWDWTGNATGHLWELNQNTGNPSAGTHMAHIQAEDNDVLLMHLVHTGTPTAGYFSIDTTDDASSAGDILFVNSNGYLGLNDATPSYLLDVNGDARIVGTATTTNLEVITNSKLGTIVSGTWNGTAIDISDYTNLAVGAVGLSLTGDSIELTSGYKIPLTASTTNWETMYNDYFKYDKSFYLASSTSDNNGNTFETSGTSTFTIWTPEKAVTLANLYCVTEDAGTVQLRCGDGTNWTETITCDTDGQADDGSITNGTFTAREKFKCEVGTQSTNPDSVTVTTTFSNN